MPTPTYCYSLVRDLLYPPDQFGDLGAILLIGRREVQSQQRAQRVHDRMNLLSFASFGPIVACARTTPLLRRYVNETHPSNEFSRQATRRSGQSKVRPTPI